MTLQENNHSIRILVTGASGFIGQNFLDAFKNHLKIFALSRRLPLRQALTEHPNITWIQADICSEEAMNKAGEIIREAGGVQFIYHLAGFYDFNYDRNPEYFRTNVTGTENVLKLAQTLNIDRFIFASSVAACIFPEQGHCINEKSPASAPFEYARTKQLGEELTKRYSAHFNASIVRFGAAFSDWCEYGPLFHFFKTWTSKSWKSHMLGGKGQSSITYIHVNCLNDLILRIVKKSQELPSIATYIASPDTPVSHRELHKLTTRYYFGTPAKPILIPKILAWTGVVVMDLFGKLIGHRPFERPWMMQYIDKELFIDASYTRNELDWQPTFRYRIQRRLLYMVENMKSYPFEWQKRNLRASKSLSMSPNIMICQALEDYRDSIVENVLNFMRSSSNKKLFSTYQGMEKELLRKDILAVYQFLSVAVRFRDRHSALAYARQTASLRHQEGFPLKEVMEAFISTGEIIQKNLIRHPSLKGMEMALYDDISLTFQLMVDEVQGMFETIDREQNPL